jgi:hypothetical protein
LEEEVPKREKPQCGEWGRGRRPEIMHLNSFQILGQAHRRTHMETKKAVQRCPNSSPQQKTLNNFNRV